MFSKLISLFKPGRSIDVSNVQNSQVAIIDQLILTSSFEVASSLLMEKITKKEISKMDQKKFIENASVSPAHISRSFYVWVDDLETNINNFYDEKTTDIPLRNEIIEKNKILVLGSPGLGKTTELEKLAVEIWHDDSDFIPIYRNLKNFTAQDSIESFIALNWARLHKIVFIFDGIDEISDIHDFVSKLETFITALDNYDLKHKFVVSCRTNVYEDSIKQITDFNILILRDLDLHESIELLTTSCKRRFDKSQVDDTTAILLKNPFQVQIIANYINKTGQIPTNSSEMWEQYIDKRLMKDERFKFLKRKLNSSLIKNYSKITSLVNELMKRNTFSDDDIYEMVGRNSTDFDAFKKNPLMEKSIGSNFWSFEHRNVQEYFAASKLSEKNLESIIAFIEVENTGRTHPSLFNTITFLINLLPKDSKKHSGLVDWFRAKEPETLFKADNERISIDIREQVFKEYFEKNCREKTLWINNDRKFDIAKIAKFGDCKNNFDYLMVFIKDVSFHYRVRYSALELLQHFKIPIRLENEIKGYFLNALRDETLEIGIKSQIINYFESKPIYNEDEGLLRTIFEIFKKESNKQINAQLLHLISNKKNVDQFSYFLIREFCYANGLEHRAEEDDIGRGNQYMVEKLILKFNSAVNFLNVCKHYFNKDIELDNKDQALKIIDKCKLFIAVDENFLLELLNEMKEPTHFYIHNNLLLNLICDTDKRDLATDHLLSNRDFDTISSFIACLVNSTNLDMIGQAIIDKKIENQEVEKFRNRISNTNSVSMAIRFHNLMEEKGVSFDEPVYTEEQQNNNRKAYHKKAQDNFDLLFNKEELLSQVKKIFDDHNEELNWNEIHEIENTMYRNSTFSLGPIVNTPLRLLHEIFPRRRGSSTLTINYEKVNSILNENHYILVHLIEKGINLFTRSHIPYSISSLHKKVLQDWCLGEAENLDFDNVITLKSTGKSFSYSNDNYSKIKTIYFFENLLEFVLPKKFYLDSIEFFELDKTTDLNSSFNALKDKVNDEDAFNERIVFNLIHKNLFFLQRYKHIHYALDNLLEAAYPKIREYFINDDSMYNESKRIELYYTITNDINFLLECCTDQENQKYWACIQIMTKYGLHNGFCIDAALSYLNSQENRYRMNALNVLFLNNKIEAIDELIRNLEKKNHIPSLRSVAYDNYNAIEDYGYIQRLFDIIYNKDFDPFEGHYYQGFFTTYLSNIVKKGNIESEQIFAILESIKTYLKKKDSDLFYINLVIEDIKDQYILSKNKTYTLDEALAIATS